MKLNNNTYIFSDPHYGHKNVVAGETNWFYDEELTETELEAIRWDRCRPFNTLKEHNETIVSRINEKVPETAILICLGDWSFGGIENIWEFRKQINCKNIHLILGNHDHHIDNNKELPNAPYQPARDGGERLARPSDLFTSISHYKEAQYKVDGYKYHFVLSHYAMRVWNKSHHGSIMLYGHSHGTLDEFTPNIANPTWIGDKYYIRNYRTMDVGVDTNDYYPYHIDEIVDMMRDREIGMEVDHH